MNSSGRKVFVSSAPADRKFLTPFLKAMKSRRMDSWSPENLRPGDNWREMVLEHVRSADFIVVLASAPSVLHGSSAARFEVGSASALGKSVFVVMPDKYSTRDLPDDLRSERVVFADIREPERAAEKLASVVFADAV